MVEGTRLESVCARKSTEGSNPSLSAKFQSLDGAFRTFPDSPGPMQGTTTKPRQIRKEATVGSLFLCRSVPGLSGEVFYF